MQKKQPARKCVGCKNMISKKVLMRIVRSKDGKYILDLSFKEPGRGAYMCPTESCFSKAIKTKGFERSYKSFVPKEIYESLKNEILKL